MAYFPMTPSACIWLMAASVAFTGSSPWNYCELIFSASPRFQRVPEQGREAGCCRPPAECNTHRASPGADEGVRPYASCLRGFAWAFALDGLLAGGRCSAYADLDLLGLGFGLFGQIDLQHALVVVGRDVLGVHG